MKLVPVTEDVKPRRKGNNIGIINQFLEMDADVVEVKDHYCSNALSAYSSLLQTINRMGFDVSVMRRKDKVYLIKGGK
jgi:hypothetical protein